MGEIPIYTSKAHVFIIEPVSKTSWIPMSKAAAVVNFYFDSSRRTYRIICVEGTKVVINSTVTENMAFTKTAAKFGQWADLRANTVYGLGFSSDVELTKFQEQFRHICSRVKDLCDNDDTRGAIDDISNGINDQHLTDKIEDPTVSKSCEEEMFSSASDDSRYNYHLSELKTLQSQNDKLKNIVAHSSAHAKKSETELQALKNTNTRLTTALQESIANVDQWQKQITTYKEDNERYKKRIAEFEAQRSKEAEFGERLIDMRREVEQLQKDYSDKCQECNMLQQRVGVLAVIERQHNECAAKIKRSFTEANQFKAKIASLEETMAEMTKEKGRRQLVAQQEFSKLSALLTEITTVTQKLQVSL